MAAPLWPGGRHRRRPDPTERLRALGVALGILADPAETARRVPRRPKRPARPADYGVQL